MKEKYYCGPKGTPKILRSDYFEEACKWHDKDYKSAKLSRKMADYWFFTRMINKPKIGIYRKAQAYLFYFLVRTFGWIFYGK